MHDDDRASRVPLLLLPGMLCDHALWQPQIDALAAQREITVVDFTGASSIGDMAQRVIDAAGDTPRALAGLSMGGIVAFEVWRKAPQQVAGLALLDTNHLPDAPDRRGLRAEQVEQAQQGQLYWLIRDDLKPAYRTPNREPSTAVLDTIMAMGLRHGPGSFIAQSNALRDRLDSSATLCGITVPTLVLCGAEDALCPLDRHEAMARAIPNSELVVVPDCGHLSTLEQPDAVNKALVRWLARVDKRTAISPSCAQVSNQ